MNQNHRKALIAILITANLTGIGLITSSSAKADNHILRDVGIGAGTGVVSGAIRNRGSVFHHAIKGAAAGAAVNGANGLRKKRNRKHRNLVQDVGVGAGASVLTGRVIHGGGHTLGDAVDGAAVGGAIHLFTNGK
jgi:uncharacterized protein YfiM (DUF2279 family)